MLKYSNNMTAELVGIMASAQYKSKMPSSLRGSGSAMADWASKALNMKNCKFVDHSGLGDKSKITAISLTRALAKAERMKILHPILKPIKQSAEGIKQPPMKVNAKTGTLFFTSTLAGYAEGTDGRMIAFTILSTNSNLRSKIDRNSEERPPGYRGWSRRARTLQQILIDRWARITDAPT